MPFSTVSGTGTGICLTRSRAGFFYARGVGSPLRLRDGGRLPPSPCALGRVEWPLWVVAALFCRWCGALGVLLLAVALLLALWLVPRSWWCGGVCRAVRLAAVVWARVCGLFWGGFGAWLGFRGLDVGVPGPLWSVWAVWSLPVARWGGSGLCVFCPYWFLTFPGRPCTVVGSLRAFSFASRMAHALVSVAAPVFFSSQRATVIRLMRWIIAVFTLFYSSHCAPSL